MMQDDKRRVARIPVNAEVRVRAAGSSGRGIPCRVSDSSAAGIRFRSPEEINPGWAWVEVLKSSGEALNDPVECRVVRTRKDEEGYQEIGCSFE